MGRVWATVVIALIAICGSGCESPSDQCIGRHYTEVARDWGPPTNVRTYGTGGQVMVWASEAWGDGPVDAASTVGGGSETAFSRSYWSPESHHRRRSRLLYVNADGFVTACEWIAR